MPNLKGWELLIIIAIVLLLFGAKRLPDAARGLGRSLRIFKAETKGLTEGESATDAPAVEQPPADQAPQSLPPAQDSTPADPVPTERKEG